MVVLITREEGNALAAAGCVMVAEYLQDDTTYGSWQDITACSPVFIARLTHYFLTYKDVRRLPPTANVNSRTCMIAMRRTK